MTKPCLNTPACAGTCEPCGVEFNAAQHNPAHKRDLLADMAICDAATPGPWIAGRSDIATYVDGEPSKWIYAGDTYVAIASGFQVEPWQQVMANAKLIAAAREGWPHAIARALAAEAELAELRETTTYQLVDDDANVWECSHCRELWVLTTGTPQENEMQFCPKCGRRITYE